MLEEWRDIEGFPGYRVSNTGRVWSDKSNKEMKENRQTSTHTLVALYTNGKRNQVRICDLVARAFLDYNSDLDDFIHIDRNRRNNEVSNILVVKNCNYLNYINKLIELKDGEEFVLMYDYDNIYISNYGRVYSGSMFDFMKINTPDGGYSRVDILRNNCRKGYYIHRVVADHFIENVDGKDYVNHIDLNKGNPHYINLEWVSHSENIRHAVKNRIGMYNFRKERKDKDCLLKSGELISECCIGDSGAYMVTNFGRVYSNKTSVWLRQSIHSGYCRVRLYENEKPISIAVHRLVAHAFIAQNHFTDLFVNHIDANRSNNVDSNLEWVTQSENMKKAFHETHANVAGNRKTALTDSDLANIRKLYATGNYTYKQIGKIYDVKKQTISNIVNRLICYKNR